MVKLASTICSCAAAAFAVTAGISQVSVPVDITQPGLIWDERMDIPVLTVSVEPLSGVRLEGCYGFRATSETDDNAYSDDIDSKTHVFGISSFYTLLGIGNAELSAGLRYLHSSIEFREETGSIPLTSSMDRYGPAARIDLSIPGIEEVGFYSQWGLDYSRDETVYNDGSEYEEISEQEGWSIAGPEYILSGIYYSFSL